jgi:hypothetical protein
VPVRRAGSTLMLLPLPPRATFALL